MSIVKEDPAQDLGAMPDPKLMEAMEKLAEELTKAGIMLDTGGLLPTEHGASIVAARGKLTVKDGPFTEAKELIGGYAILQVKSKEQAVEIGKRFMQLHVDILGPTYSGQVEIRQMFDGPLCPT